MSRKAAFISALALLGFALLATGCEEGGSSRTTSSTSAPAAVPSVAYPPPAPTNAQYLEQVDRELESLRTFDGSKYRSTKDEIQIEVVLFGAWANLVHEASEYTLTASERARVNQLRERVAQVQAREFPRMRAAWARILANAMWEHDMIVSSGGEANRTLRLTSVIFASNSNIAEIQRTVHEQLNLLRFKRVEYRWYRGADEYTYYSVETPADRAVREITSSGWATQ